MTPGCACGTSRPAWASPNAARSASSPTWSRPGTWSRRRTAAATATASRRTSRCRSPPPGNVPSVRCWRCWPVPTRPSPRSAKRTGGGRDMTSVWVANDEGTEIVRARDISVASLDYDGNVNVRLAGADGAVVTVVAHRAHREERRPDDFHRQLIRVIAELSDAAGAFLVRAVHDETRGWQWVSEPLQERAGAGDRAAAEGIPDPGPA